MPRPAQAHLWSRWLVAWLLSVVWVSAHAAPPAGAYQVSNSTVMLDGRPVGDGGLGTYALNNTVVHDAGLYHMWYMSAPDTRLGSIQRATSTDGIHFTTVAGSRLVPPANWWTGVWYGKTATAEPIANFIRVARMGANWILMAWHPNISSGSSGPYNYNTSLWSLGSEITTTSLAQIGPLPGFSTTPSGPGDNHVGPTGIVDDHLYVLQGSTTGFGRYGLSPMSPITSPAGQNNVGDLYADSPWCQYQVSGCAAPSYVHNQARTLDQGGTLGTYYTFRTHAAAAPPKGQRRDKQIYYVESSDNGFNWSAAQGVFANGEAVTVDGLPTTLGFSGPEVTALGAGQFRGYFNTQNICGQVVMVTASPAASVNGLNVTKAFTPSTVAVGERSTLTVTLTAPSASCTPAPATPVYSGIGFTDHLPTGLEVATTGSTTCTGATLTASAGATAVGLSGVALAAGASCTASVEVEVKQAGVFNNVIHATATPTNGGITTNEQISAIADATATLRTPAAPAASSVTAVPTLGEMATALLGLLLTAAGARGLHRLRN